MIEDRKNKLVKPNKPKPNPAPLAKSAPSSSAVATTQADAAGQQQLQQVEDAWEEFTVGALGSLEQAKQAGIAKGIDRVNSEEVPKTEAMFRGLMGQALEAAMPPGHG